MTGLVLDNLGFHLLLLGRGQGAFLLGLRAHALHRIHHGAFLSEERVAEIRGPLNVVREALHHIGQAGHRLDARIPGLLGHGIRQLLVFQVRVLAPATVGAGRSREDRWTPPRSEPARDLDTGQWAPRVQSSWSGGGFTDGGVASVFAGAAAGAGAGWGCWARMVNVGCMIITAVMTAIQSRRNTPIRVLVNICLGGLTRGWRRRFILVGDVGYGECDWYLGPHPAIL